MAWYNFGKKQESVVVENEPLYSQFSTPFGKIGDGNLSLPYVRSYGSERFVRFGNDNLFPQIVNQMYFQSALNGSIINYKANAVIGGGYELKSNDTSGLQKVKEYTFIKKNKFNKLMRQLTKDLIMHGRICVIIDPTTKDISIKRVGPEKVRVNSLKTIYTIADDWARSVGMYEIKPYYVGATEKTLFVYEIDGDAGQDIYPIPQYCSSLNDAFLDGEMSYLQKSNIINSVFPSFMIKLAKKFGSQDEINQFKDTINKAKGAPAAGRIMTFVANSSDQLPSIETIPTNNNDKIFDSTLQRVDANICRAHSIDPLLMGIRVSGALGNGNELQQSYTIFEKNVVMPLREMITEIADELLFISGINSTITINNYQIIDEVIVDKTNPTK
jgi:hypothetical protein